jgi:hypothetical protein
MYSNSKTSPSLPTPQSRRSPHLSSSQKKTPPIL